MASAASPNASASNPFQATGPRTAEGKATSSQNARKHGLCSNQLVIREDQREDYEALHTSLYAELEPANRMESIFVDQMIVSDWNMARIREMEVEYHIANPDARSSISSHKELILLRRYYIAAERGFFRAMRELRSLQAIRVARRDNLQAGPMLVKPPHPSHRSLADTVEALSRMNARAAQKTQNTQVPNEPPPAAARTPRNATCPCGSHMKFKRCCGRNVA